MHAGPFVAVDLCPFMCAQPIQLFIKHTGSDKPLLNVLIWHQVRGLGWAVYIG